MFNFKRWRRRESDLEAALRQARVEPRDELVRSLSRRIAPSSGYRSGRPWSRVAFAGAVTTLMFGMVASFGGVGYAASGADQSYHVVKALVVKHHITVHHSAAGDQYPKNPTSPSNPPSNPPSAGVAESQAQGGVAAAQSGTLPFTGFSLLVTVLVSLGLIATGLVLRRRERTDSK
jgi:hypothetical protein